MICWELVLDTAIEGEICLRTPSTAAAVSTPDDRSPDVDRTLVLQADEVLTHGVQQPRR
ncbi:hypothetical protein [Amycolatopsis sp. NPDC004378]